MGRSAPAKWTEQPFTLRRRSGRATGFKPQRHPCARQQARDGSLGSRRNRRDLGGREYCSSVFKAPEALSCWARL